MDVEKLALRPREACRALGVCPRTLWKWTQEGRIPCVRVGKTVLYPKDLLAEWLRREAAQQAAAAGQGGAEGLQPDAEGPADDTR